MVLHTSISEACADSILEWYKHAAGYLEKLVPSTKLHGITLQKTVVLMSAIVAT